MLITHHPCADKCKKWSQKFGIIFEYLEALNLERTNLMLTEWGHGAVIPLWVKAART